jgi:ubiquitin C-terminal hydrolase
MIGHKDTPYLSDHTAKHRNRIATSIQVNVKGCNTLEECLNDYVKGEQISGYSGAKEPGVFGQKYPEKRITVLKRTSFKTLPNTLTIGLNRMEFTWDNNIGNMVGRKLVHRVAFPFELNMR